MTRGIVFLMGCAISTSPDWETPMVGKWSFQKMLKGWSIDWTCDVLTTFCSEIGRCSDFVVTTWIIELSLWLCYVMLCFIFAWNNQYINIVSLCFTFHVLSCRPDLSCQKLPPGAFPTETRRKSTPGVIRRAQKNAEMLPGEDSDLVLRKPSPSTRYLFWKAICVYPLCVELLFLFVLMHCTSNWRCY